MIRCARVSTINALLLALIACGVSHRAAAARSRNRSAAPFSARSPTPRGAVMADAKVTVVNEGTGLTRTVTADANGEYTVPSLPTGRYTVTAEMAGFKTAGALEHRARRRPARAHRPQARSRRDDRVGHHRSRRRPLLQTSSSELGTTVTNEQIEALPLNGRNFVSLTRTVPGVLRGIPGANIDGAGSLAWRASASFSANGQRARDNNFMLDGVDNNETWLQTVVIFPSVDALDEFKLQTSHLLGRVRPIARRRRQPADQVGHQHAARQRLRVPPQRRVRRQQLLQQPRRAREARLQAEPVRRHARRRRSSRTRRSSSPTIRGTARSRDRRSCRRCRRWRCARATSPS